MAGLSNGLNSGRFWPAVRKRSRDALRAGALQPISTNSSYVQDGAVEFVVRVSDNLVRKRDAPGSYGTPRTDNPFLPTDPALTVGTLPPHHVAVLNKYNVLEDHVLVVTRGFVHQESPLTAGDFAAVAPGLTDGAGLAFYNGGKTAGASQPHKHLQLVPLPLGRSADVPAAVLFDDAADGANTVRPLRFRHFFSRLDPASHHPAAFGEACHDLYRAALVELGLVGSVDDREDARLPPYNLLLTQRWLFLVSRGAERHLGISVNGLGYAGSLFVSSTEKLDQVRAAGPMTILERVSMAWD